jgi:putative FmdB family regulatory protein
MPTYPYICDACGEKKECMQKITADPLKTCDSCGKDDLRRLPGGGIGLVFKGSGFYITDYKNSNSSPKEKESSPVTS